MKHQRLKPNKREKPTKHEKEQNLQYFIHKYQQSEYNEKLDEHLQNYYIYKINGLSYQAYAQSIHGFFWPIIYSFVFIFVTQKISEYTLSTFFGFHNSMASLLISIGSLMLILQLVPVFLNVSHKERKDKVKNWYKDPQNSRGAKSEQQQYVVKDKEENIYGSIYYQLMNSQNQKQYKQQMTPAEKTINGFYARILQQYRAKVSNDYQILIVKDFSVTPRLDYADFAKVIDLLFDQALQFQQQMQKSNKKQQEQRFVFFFVNSQNMHLISYLEARYKFKIEQTFYPTQNESMYGNLSYILVMKL